MENVLDQLKEEIKIAFNELFNYECDIENISIDVTPKNFEGFYTLVIFPHLKSLKSKPEDAGDKIGKYLISNSTVVSDYNVVKGFLNLDLSDSYFKFLFNKMKKSKDWWKSQKKDNEVMVEFSSPNTNKPLHLGHLRNIFLGDSVSKIFEAYGYKAHKVQIINDRGIHICKSMVAWKNFSNGKTPESEKIKGDKFVGNYYVKFETENQKQIKKLIEEGYSEDDALKSTPLMKEAINLLQLWENKDDETIELWKKMNGWVYNGFESTYKSININFDKNYYESDTYLLGKKNVEKGLKNGLFYQKNDGSIWVDLIDEGLDNKILIRSDGTSVYITQDIGTAIKRFEDFPKIEKQIYTVGNEQDYHFKVLFKILDKLNYNWANKLQHLSYGMVDLPSGKMKSREGSVVDADELISSMINKAKVISDKLGKINDLLDSEKKQLYKTIALGALKYHILKVDPKKKILFNPEESIDFNGNTGPFIQYTYARIKSILDKNSNTTYEFDELKLAQKEKELIILLCEFRNILNSSVKKLNPSLIANHIYEVVKLYNSYYQTHTILGNKNINSFRVFLSEKVAIQIEKSMGLLGISVPNRM